MQIGGPIAMIFLIAFVLFMIYDVSTSEPAELKMEFFITKCQEDVCHTTTKRIPNSVTPFECFRYGQVALPPVLAKGYKIKRWGCRPATLGV
jgi:hypothetical protein